MNSARADDKHLIEQVRYGMSEVRAMLDSILEDDDEDGNAQHEAEADRAFELDRERKMYDAAVQLSNAYRARRK